MTSAPVTKCCAVCGNVFAKPPSDSRKTWEKRKCCTYKCSVEIRRGRPNPKAAYWKGKTQPPEIVAKRAATLAKLRAEGKVRNARANLGLRGEQTSQWRGDNVQYRAAHARLRSHRGLPAACEFCGGEAHEWALSNEAEIVKVQETGPRAGLRFSPRPSDYVALCRACHRLYDRERDPLTGRYL